MDFLTFDDFLRIMECLFQSLFDLGKINIVHRDIKMENFLVKIFDIGFKVQIADFSEAKIFDNSKVVSYISIKGNKAHISPEFMLNMINDTDLNYKSYEILENQ